MKTLATLGLGTFNTDIDNRGRQIISLVQQYIPGLAHRYYGYKSIGFGDVAFPAFFVEPMDVEFHMVTTGKTQLDITFSLEWYVIDNNPEDALTLCTFAADALKKLFSNNALGNSNNQFKNNPGYWIYSEMSAIQIGRSLRNPTGQNDNRYLRAGRMQLKVQDIFAA